MPTRFRYAWVAAVVASTAAFVFALGVRARCLQLGYAILEAGAEQRALVETKQQLELSEQVARRAARDAAADAGTSR